MLDLLYRPAAKRRTHVRDDAVAAIEQAAVLHLDESALMTVEARDAMRQHGHIVAAQLLPKSGLVGDDVGYAGKTCHRSGIARGEAAHDDDVSGRVLLGQPSHELATFGIRLARHRA